MIHLNFKEFEAILNKLKDRSWNSSRGRTIPEYLIGQWYVQYLKYENDWNYYFHNIFLPNLITTKDCTINIVLYESGPGGFSFPHPNYMFLSEMLDQPIYNKHMDKYINDVIRMAGITAFPPTRRGKLSVLAKQGYLIIDLLPTHGITLKNRIEIWNDEVARKHALKKIVNSIEITKEKLGCVHLKPKYHPSAEVEHIHGKTDDQGNWVIVNDDLRKKIFPKTKKKP